MGYSLKKRTFEARDYPEGSPERVKFNEETETSEYQPDYEYILYTEFGAIMLSKEKLEEIAEFI